ncbi:hypothetical protein BKA63DRAFT_281474 [Paraphoma chrysanthemicola]|nr:hypothetical protein BKA63DRAFT_281474 [Paraphoma chrysanthemicola]
MSGRSSEKSTRSSIACLACRARKHRCSGEKPRCAQCKSNKVPCEWPAQQKRGPPKQYINSIESRLAETENVLLALLSQVTFEQLQASFQSVVGLARARSPSLEQAESDSPSSPVTRRDPAHWASFPLDSPENVRRWWEVRRSSLQQPGPESQFAAASCLPAPESNASYPFYGGDAKMLGNVQRENELPTHGTDIGAHFSGNSEPNNSVPDMSFDAHYVSESTVDTSLAAIDPQGSVTYEQTTLERSETARSDVSTAPLAQSDVALQLSDEFKHDYLW